MLRPERHTPGIRVPGWHSPHNKGDTVTIQLHLIILTTLAVLFAAAAALGHLRFKKTWAEREGKRNPKWSMLTYDKEDLPSYWVRAFATGLAGFVVGIWLIALIPFNPAYWILTQHEGTVASISNRFVDGTGDISGGTYTLTLDGDPTPRIVTDSRILSLKVGDRVDLTCSLGWVYGGADTNNCYMRSF
jgi:hypothetical protein